MHHRAFVCRDGVGSEFQRGRQMFDGGLTGLDVKRARLKQYIRARFFHPLANIARGLRVRVGPVAVEDGDGIQAIGIG